MHFKVKSLLRKCEFSKLLLISNHQQQLKEVDNRNIVIENKNGSMKRKQWLQEIRKIPSEIKKKCLKV